MTLLVLPDSPAFRLKSARRELGLTQEEFGAPMGYGKAAVSTWETGKTEVSQTLAQSIQVNWGIAWKWLIFGEGPPWSVAPADQVRESIQGPIIFRPEISGTALTAKVEAFYSYSPKAITHPLSEELVARVLQESGGGTEEDLFFVRCKGTSMEPTLRDDELVLINTNPAMRQVPDDEGIYLVRRSVKETEARLRRVRLFLQEGQVEILSDSHTLPPLFLDLEGLKFDQLLIGRACWVWRSLLITPLPESNW